MLCAYLPLFNMPAQFLDWARLHITALNVSFRGLVIFRRVMMDPVASACHFECLARSCVYSTHFKDIRRIYIAPRISST